MEQWRRMAAMSSSDEPFHSRAVANECRSKCAAPGLGRTTPVRRNALSTIIVTATRSTEGAIRSTAMDKQRIGIGPRPTYLQVGYDRLTHFLGQWQSRVASALTASLYRCILPVKCPQSEMHGVACGSTQTSHHHPHPPPSPPHAYLSLPD